MSHLYHSGGHLELILGPMFAGKTSELMRRMKRYQIAKKRCLLVKYKGDDRYSVDMMSTHDRQMCAASPCDRLSEVENIVDQYDCIGVDEGQFFPDLVKYCDKWANAGKCVVVAALDGTFQRRPFGSVIELIPMAEDVTKLTAVCMICSRDAHFSKRITDEEAVEVIGGSDTYIAVCRACFNGNQVPMSMGGGNAAVGSNAIAKKKIGSMNMMSSANEVQVLSEMTRNIR